MKTDPKFWRWLGLSAAVIVIDQLTKYWVAHALPLHGAYTVTAFFDLVFVYNPGAAFSFLANAAGWQRWFFVVLALGVAGWLVGLLRRQCDQPLQAAALSFIIGGALGNVVDRILIGQVVDFLSFHLGTHYFPAFNAADSAITLGVILMLLGQLREARAPETP